MYIHTYTPDRRAADIQCKISYGVRRGVFLIHALPPSLAHGPLIYDGAEQGFFPPGHLPPRAIFWVIFASAVPASLLRPSSLPCVMYCTYMHARAKGTVSKGFDFAFATTRWCFEE